MVAATMNADALAKLLTESEQEAPQAELPPYFDRPRLSNRWDCSISTLKRKEKAGELVSTRFGARVVRYSRDEVLRIENGI